jgi:hypothetical protein
MSASQHIEAEKWENLKAGKIESGEEQKSVSAEERKRNSLPCFRRILSAFNPTCYNIHFKIIVCFYLEKTTGSAWNIF